MVTPAAIKKTALAILRRKLLLAGILGVASFASVYAFAATLNVSSQSLGAGNSVVASCVPSTVTLTASYSTTYDSTFAGYRVSNVRLNASVTGTNPPTATNIPLACAGKLVTVDLAGVTPTNTSLGEASLLIPASPPAAAPGPTFDIPIPATGGFAPPTGTGVFPVKASDVANVSVVIAG